MKRCRRAVFGLIGFGAIGLVLTVGLAFLSAFFVGFTSADSGTGGCFLGSRADSEQRWNFSRVDSFAATRIIATPDDMSRHRDDSDCLGFGLPFWTEVHHAASSSGPSRPGGALPVIVEDARGWPFRALCCLWPASTGLESGLALTPWSKSGGVVTAMDLRAFPMRPYWPGLVGDVVVLGLGSWLVLQFIPLAQASICLWRGKCPKCRYPLSRSGRCSECGYGA